MDTNLSNADAVLNHLEIAQRLILTTAASIGRDSAERIVEEAMSKLDPYQAAILRGLMLAMSCETCSTVH